MCCACALTTTSSSTVVPSASRLISPFSARRPRSGVTPLSASPRNTPSNLSIWPITRQQSTGRVDGVLESSKGSLWPAPHLHMPAVPLPLPQLHRAGPQQQVLPQLAVGEHLLVGAEQREDAPRGDQH